MSGDSRTAFVTNQDAGTLSLMILAPPLAEIALSFSTFEYFWLAFLGLMCATLVARSSSRSRRSRTFRSEAPRESPSE